MDRELFYISMSNEERLKYNKSIENSPLTEEQKILVENNVKLITYCIKSLNIFILNRAIIDFEDLFQIGCIGLIKGLKTFKYNYYDENGNQNEKLATYICVCIRNEVKMSLRSYNRIMNNTSLSLQDKIYMNYNGTDDNEGTVEANLERLSLSSYNDTYDMFDSLKYNIDINITKNIIRRVREEIDKIKDVKNSSRKKIYRFLFDTIVNDVDYYYTISELRLLYNNKYNTNLSRSYIQRKFQGLKELVARICVEEDDTLSREYLISVRRYSY